ncbi:vomeronasal type-1 receptor 1-like [Trichosurus vulpecula]|uniref:vomeronasal type-1 receptor 1-like n=1 Tax=Trichosurus vulpecula TaxID=9337 RepID=UPI00186AF2BB|nr:vomeronasal type-1 receptor 1-like [Trichosurus vulpecula]
MNPNGIILSIVFFSHTAVGVLGNAFLVCLFFCMFFIGHRLRPTDTILAQLACFNFLFLLSKGIPQTMAALGLKNFLDDNGCITVFYLHKVSRGLSLSITCLLSGFQAITISPSSSKWAEVKARAPKYIVPTSSLCCVTHLLLNIIVFVKVKDPQSSRNSSELHDYGFCSGLESNKVRDALFGVVVSLRDAVFVGLMVFASGYMILLLHRHHKRNQHLYMTSLSPTASPRARATQSILLLVSTFVCFYSLNSILISYMYFREPRLWLIQCSAFLSICFPTFSPFVLISSDSQLLKYYYDLWGKKVPHL